MEAFLALLSIATSILCIILFFKVWGMTNDVDKIKSKYVDSVPTSVNLIAKYTSIKGVKGAEAAKDFLLNYIVDYAYEKFGNAVTEDNIEAIEKEIKMRFGFLFQDAEAGEPSFSFMKNNIEEQRKRMPIGFEIGSEVIYKGEDMQEWKATLLGYNPTGQTFVIKLANAGEIEVPISSCQTRSK